MDTHRRLAFLAVFLFVTSIGCGYALGGGLFPETLKGVKECGISIDGLREDYPLIHDQLRTDIELKLRMAGLKVTSNVMFEFRYTKENKRYGYFHPYLHLYLLLGKVKETLPYVWSVQLTFNQMAHPDLNPDIMLPVPFWKTPPTVGISGDIEHASSEIRSTVRDDVDKFINDWLSVNPKQ